MILDCWIIDDEPLALSLLEAYIEKTPFLNLTGKFPDAGMAMTEILTRRPNLIFLDIQMPRVNGMEFVRCVPAETRIIFITAFRQYAIEGYKVNALDYLLKPVSYADFLTASKKALDWFETTKTVSENEQQSTNSGSIFVKSDYKLLRVLFSDIIYVEGLKDYIKIHTQNENRPVLTLMSMKSIEGLLPSSMFIRVHRSFIVRKNKISSVNKSSLSIGKREIPIGRTYRQAVEGFVGKK
jgi:DNA-binding LytR/AlgR family response regulator